MALFCFWYRRACSRYVALGLPLPAESPLEAHMESCSECRIYWLGLSSLSSDLGRLLTVPQPSAGFASSIPELPRSLPAGFDWRRVSLVAAGACGLACGWAAWRLTTGMRTVAPEQVVRQYPRKVFDGGPTMAAPDLPEVLPDRPSDLDRLPIRRSQHGKMVTWRSIPHTHRPRRHAPGFVSREEPLSPELARAAAAGQWQASGLVYESQGDPATANVAYQAAYEERPTEDSAFDVGRSAEESGDMDQAMNAYASLLEAADMKSRSEKGLRP